MKTIKFRAKTKKGTWIYNLLYNRYQASVSWWERFKDDIEVIGNRYDNPEVFDQYAQESRV